MSAGVLPKVRRPLASNPNLHERKQCSWTGKHKVMSSKDGRDNMAQDQETTNPLIQPVMEEFDVSTLTSEVNAVDADLSDAPFVELNSLTADGSPDEPDETEPTESEESEPDTEAELQEEPTDQPEAEDVDTQEAEREPSDSTDDAVEVDEAEIEVEDEPEGEPVVAPGTPDKALQKLQQRQSTFEQSINDKLDQLTTILSQHSPQNGQDEQPPADAKSPSVPDSEPGEFEAALAELQEFAKDDDEFDEPTKADLSKVVNGLVKALSNLKAPQAEVPQIEGLDEVRQHIQQQKQEAAVQEAWQNFETSHGYDGKPLWRQAMQDASRIYPDASDQDMRLNLAQRYFDRRVEKRDSGEEEAPVKEAPKKKVKKAVVKPASSKPRTPTKGTQTAPTGALGAGQAKKTSALPPIFTT